MTACSSSVSCQPLMDSFSKIFYISIYWPKYKTSIWYCVLNELYSSIGCDTLPDYQIKVTTKCNTDIVTLQYNL